MPNLDPKKHLEWHVLSFARHFCGWVGQEGLHLLAWRKLFGAPRVLLGIGSLCWMTGFSMSMRHCLAAVEFALHRGVFSKKGSRQRLTGSTCCSFAEDLKDEMLILKCMWQFIKNDLMSV